MRHLGQLLGRSGRAVWRWRYLLPLTPLGLTVALLGYLASDIFGRQRADIVLHVAGLVALLMVATALIVVAATGLWVWLRLRRTPGEVDLALETGGQAATGLLLPRLGGWPLVTLDLLWEEPVGFRVELVSRRRGSEEQVCPGQRGEARQVRRRIMVKDIFGLARIGLPRRSAARLRVSPARTQVTAHAIERYRGGDALSYPWGPPEGERLEMRRYAHGDPLRYVLWKAFARTRQLLVRAPERAVSALPSIAAYLVAGEGDEPAASAARFFVEEGLLGDAFLFAADGGEAPVGDRQAALQQIIASVRWRKQGGAGLERFLRALDAARRQSLVLFVPPQPGPWLRQVERLAGSFPGAAVITALDDRLALAPSPRWRRLLFEETASGQAATRALGEVISRLTSRGLTVQVLHRPSGEFLPARQLAALAGARP